MEWSCYTTDGEEVGGSRIASLQSPSYTSAIGDEGITVLLKKLALSLAAVCVVATSGVAFADDKPLPDGIRVINQDEAKACQFVDIVSAMKFAMISASGSQRAALIDALEKAKKKGANAAVVTEITAHNNQHQVTLTAYKCS